MHWSFTLTLLVASACGQSWPFDVTTISSPDKSISASTVSIGATLTELWVKDRHGKARDVIIGYDDQTMLLTDPDHPDYNPIIGRYAGRIKNGTFSIPITKTAQPPGPNVYELAHNDAVGDKSNTLHGGVIGWDRRNWTIHAHSPSSVTYKHVDRADEGFPGTVTVYATHTVKNGGIYEVQVVANAEEKTPIGVTQHIYLNLDAFQDGSVDILNHTLKLDASKVPELDNNLIPTGKFYDVNKDTLFDFRKPRKLGDRLNDTLGICGPGCLGYDHSFIHDKDFSKKGGFSLSSELSGIRLDITTNQPSTHIYTAFWLNKPRKQVHGGSSLNYGPLSAVAVEQGGYPDAINTPEWGVDQIYEPGRKYVWQTQYSFTTF